MSLLKKIGTILGQVTQVVLGVGPLVRAVAPAKVGAIEQELETDLAQIGQIIVLVESFGQSLNTPGQDKLKAAAPLVAQILLKSAVVAQHKIEKPELFQQGARKIADGMADVLNSLKADHVDGDNKA